MKTLHRFALAVFGVACGLVGLCSLVAAVLLFSAPRPANLNDPTVAMVIRIFNVLLTEVFLAFGVVAMLVGVRCVLGPRPWIVGAIEGLWRRAMWFALAMPLLGVLIAYIT